MNANEFVSETYRRGAELMPNGPVVIQVASFLDTVNPTDISLYENILPSDKHSKIIDIGSGNGHFLAACHKLGYEDIRAADFRAVDKFSLVTEALSAIKTEDFEGSIAEYFAKKNSEYDVINFSHVIEHIPKYSLIETMDALCNALRPGGKIIVRTPNMEGPSALSSYYVTLAHEYGFVGSNLHQLLHICGFKEIEFIDIDIHFGLLRRLIRLPFKAYQRVKSRLFGVNQGRQFGSELIAIATR